MKSLYTVNKPEKEGTNEHTCEQSNKLTDGGSNEQTDDCVNGY